MATEIPIRPGHGTAGRHPTRQSLDLLSGHDNPGMFGRMFPRLDAFEPPANALEELAEAMKDSNPGSADGNNEEIPAGFTYLGQFVDHDITLDLTSIGDKQADPMGTENFRTPALDLDSIYGLGPDGSRPLYARASADSGKTPGPKFLIGNTSPAGEVTKAHPNDLPRNPEGFALIGDHRNDENLVVAQTHLAMLKFHNKVCDRLRDDGTPAETLFLEARRVVTWHYQWMVLHDFVEKLCGDGIVAKILHDGRKFYRFKEFPYMPVEFSGAAYRLGHSMVRERYNHNRIFTAATLAQLFQFTGLSGDIRTTLPGNWIIDWRRYFKFPAANPAGVPVNSTRKIDPFLVPALHTLPGGGGSLPLRNLQRGVHLGLPSGQDVAAAMGIKPLTPAQVSVGPDGAVAKQHSLHVRTPLFYYILKEAEQIGKGKKLGPVGATIVAEVFVGLVHGDRESYLWKKGPGWKPDLPSAKKGEFRMTDLLQFVGDVSPIDGIETV